MPNINLFGVRMPVSRWTVTWFSVVAGFVVAGLGYRQVFPEQPELITLRQANHNLSMQIAEYDKHVMDVADREEELFNEGTRGSLALRLFSDNCLLLRRKTPEGATQVKLLVDIARTDLVEHKEGDEVKPEYAPNHLGSLISIPLYAQSPCNGRCLNPHPGQYVTRYGERNGCLVQVWRRWPEGCEHWQWLNSCNGAWDSNPDGSPRVTWVCCRH